MELWPLTVTQTKKLEAAHHKFQRRLLRITWKDKVKNKDIRKKTGLRWLQQVTEEKQEKPGWWQGERATAVRVWRPVRTKSKLTDPSNNIDIKYL